MTCWRHDLEHREYICRCDPPIAGDTGREPDPRCERCPDPIEERFCTHRDLCPDCLHHCHDCAAEFTETAAYESERDDR